MTASTAVRLRPYTLGGSVKNYRKFLVAALSGATTAVSLGLLADPWDKYVAVVSATLGALGVFAVTNEQPV